MGGARKPKPLGPKQIVIGDGKTLAPEKREEIFQKQRIIYAYTIPIIVDATNGTNPEIGTGVVVEIGKQLFVASAAHVIDKKPFLGFGDGTKLRVPVRPSAYIRRELHAKRDLGFIEVKPGSHPSACPFDALSTIDPPQGVLVMIVGHPIHAPGSAGDPAWGDSPIRALIRTSHMAKPRKILVNKHVFGYPKDTLYLDGETGTMTKSTGYQSPKGFSGGGAWGFRDNSATQAVLKPSNMLRLHGIDYAWSPPKREAYCVPIIFWVRFVYDHYPELQAVIAAQYPMIKSVKP